MRKGTIIAIMVITVVWGLFIVSFLRNPPSIPEQHKEEEHNRLSKVYRNLYIKGRWNG